jgi:hypothetical protein
MEINSEINKVFGTEMAKLFSQSISEAEIQEKAQAVWKELNNGQWDYSGKRRESEIERYIREAILKRLYEKIDAILKEPISEEVLEKRAREMVEEARKAGEQAIIKDMASHMVNNALSIYGRDEKIMLDILNELRIQGEKMRY